MNCKTLKTEILDTLKENGYSVDEIKYIYIVKDKHIHWFSTNNFLDIADRIEYFDPRTDKPHTKYLEDDISSGLQIELMDGSKLIRVCHENSVGFEFIPSIEAYPRTYTKFLQVKNILDNSYFERKNIYES